MTVQIAAAPQPARLSYHDWPEWFEDPKVIAHNVYYLDRASPNTVTHDVSCMVCWAAPAVYTYCKVGQRHVDGWQPCDRCQTAGWRLDRHMPTWRVAAYAKLRRACERIIGWVDRRTPPETAP